MMKKFSLFRGIKITKRIYYLFMNKIYTLVLILFSLNSLADSRTFDRTWVGLFSKKQISQSSYSFWSEVQARMDNDQFTNQQLLMRWGILQKLSDKDEIGLIYAYIYNDDIKENRPTFQYTRTFIKNDLNFISLRNRLEYRKREDQDAVSGRFRMALRGQRFINQKYSLILWDEPFFNLTHEDWTGNRFLERNRLFFGAGINFDGLNFEVGYMNQLTPRSNRDIIEHIITLYAFF